MLRFMHFLLRSSSQWWQNLEKRFTSEVPLVVKPHILVQILTYCLRAPLKLILCANTTLINLVFSKMIVTWDCNSSKKWQKTSYVHHFSRGVLIPKREIVHIKGDRVVRINFITEILNSQQVLGPQKNQRVKRALRRIYCQTQKMEVLLVSWL